MNNLFRMLSDVTFTDDMKGNVQELWTVTIQPIVEAVLWILVAVLALVFIVKGITTAMAVMKAADEPQVRQEKLNAFKYMAIGLGVAIVIITSANVIIKLVTANQGDFSGLSNEGTNAILPIFFR